MNKNEKSFKTLLKQMDKLQEYQLGRLKGGISVVSFQYIKNKDIIVNAATCFACGGENTVGCSPPEQEK